MAQPDFSALLAAAPDAKPTPAPAPVQAARTAGAPDFSAVLAGAPDAAPAPAGGAGNPADFVATYKPLAQRAGKALGVAPEVLLGQWGLETGWGKSVIPGTNNLGNIKDPSGAGAQATDNQTGSRDAYRKYDNVEQFADDFAGLISRRYKSAQGSGGNAANYFTALKTGGYAEDPDYVKKGIAAATLARSAMPGGLSQAESANPYTDTRPTPIPKRSVFGAINDTVIDAANATAGLVKSGIDLFSPNSAASKFIDEEIIKAGQNSQSEYKQYLRQKLAAELKDAGVNDGSTASQVAAEFRKAGVQLAHSLTQDPLGTVGDILGNVGPFAVLGKGIQAAKLSKGVATALSSGVAAGLGVGEVRGNIWEKISGTSDADLLAASPAYAALRQQGMTEQQAKAELGANISNNLPELALVGLVSAVSGKYGAEGMMAGVAPKYRGGRLGSAAVGFVDEGPIQGGSEQVASNYGVQRVIPSQSLLEDVGPNVILEGLPGAGMGVLHSPANPAAAPAAAKAQEPNSPLSKAATAGNIAAEAMPPQPQPQPAPVDPATRLAELEAISKGTESRTVPGPDGKPVVIPGEPGRFFTDEERQEYESLKANRDATPGAVKDDLTPRAQAIRQQLAEDRGILDALRAEGSPVQPSAFLRDLSIAASKSAQESLREQALNRVEMAMQWAGVNPAKPIETNIDEIVGGRQGEIREPGARPPISQLQAGVDRDAELIAQRDGTPARNPAQGLLAEADRREQAAIDIESSPRATPEDLRRAQGLRADAAAMRQGAAGTSARPATPGAMTQAERGQIDAQRQANLEMRLGARGDRPTAEELRLQADRKEAEADRLVSDPNASAGIMRRAAELRAEAIDLRLAAGSANNAASSASKPEPIQPGEQERLEAAALTGKVANRKAEDTPRQVVIDRALRAIEQRGGVASPAEAQIVAEAGLGKPYDRIDESLAPRSRDVALPVAAPAPGPAKSAGGVITESGAPRQRDPARADRLERVKSSVELTPAGLQATTSPGAAPAREAGVDANTPLELARKSDKAPTDISVLSLVDDAANERNAAGDAAQQKAADERAARQAKQAADNAAAAAAQPARPSVDSVVSALKTIPALRTAEQKAQVDAARRTMGAEAMRLLQAAADNPANLSATDKLQLQQMREGQAKKSAERAAPAATALPPGAEPAIIRKRRRQLDQLAASGMETVERRDGVFFIRNSRTGEEERLSGRADAALARAAIKAMVDQRAHAAATSPQNDRKEPSWAQIDAVNWKKGDPIKLNGVTVRIENPVGSVRRARPDAPVQWKTTMKHHYGEIAGTKGADGDPVDVFIGPNPASPRIWVIDQVDERGAFDEHKVLFGFDSEEAARKGYMSNFSSGWKGLGSMREMTQDEFRAWAKDQGATMEPVAEKAAVDAEEAPTPQTAEDIATAVEPQFFSVPMDGKRVRLERVPTAELSDTESPERDGKARRTTKKAAALITAIAESMGKRVVFFRDTDGSRPGDGFILPSDPDTVYLNERSTISPLAVFGHEFQHTLRITNPEAWNAIAAVVRERVKDAKGFREDYYGSFVVRDQDGRSLGAFRSQEAAEAFVQRSGMQGLTIGGQSNAALSEEQGGELEELVSDLGGNLMADPKFWREVFDKIDADNGGKAKGIIARLIAQLQQLLDMAVAAVKGRPYLADRFVDDAASIRAAYRDALAGYLQSKGQSKAGMQAEILKSAQRKTWRSKVDDVFVDKVTTGAASVGGRKATKVFYVSQMLPATKRMPERYGRLVASVIYYDGLQDPVLTSYAPTAYAIDAERVIEATRSDARRVAVRDALDWRQSSVDAALKSPERGIHFSKRELTSINGAFYGTGLKGAEAERLARSNDSRLKTRVYFYIDEGKGVRPEAGVGGYAHEAKLPKLYDAKANPEKLWNSGDLNGTESRILDAGYDGYFVKQHETGQGFAVVIGPAAQSIPVKRLKDPNIQSSAQIEVPQPLARGLMSKEMNAINVAAIPGAKLRAGTLVVPPESADIANRELERIGSPIRFSKERLGTPEQELEIVRQLHQGKDTWMKAPNGKPTKLNERQWLHVRTPAFKKWFGDWEAYANTLGGVWGDGEGRVSKAVDSNGEPLVVYHGTDKGGFAEFRRPGGQKRGDLGIFTTDDLGMARSYVHRGRGRILQADEVSEVDNAGGTEAGVYALFVNIRNPSESDFEGANWDGSRQGQYVVEDEDGEPVYDDSGRLYFDDRDDALALVMQKGGSIEEAPDHDETTDSVVRDARRYKSDGAIIRRVRDEGGGNSSYFGGAADVFVALEPNQLKSADFNGGEYSVDSDDIRLSRGRSVVETPEFKRWSRGLPVVAAQDSSKYAFATGSPVVVDGFHGTRRNFDRLDPAAASDGYFMSSRPIVANEYAGYMEGRTTEPPMGGNVQRQFARMMNPLFVNARGASFNRVDTRGIPGFDAPFSNTDAINRWARAQSYDGVIYKDLRDSVSSPDGRNAPPSNVYAVFEPTQIKSAFNRGAFSDDEASFLASNERGIASAEVENRVSVVVGGKPGEFDWDFTKVGKEPPPFQAPTQFSPRLEKVGPAVLRILSSKKVQDLASDAFGIKGLRAVPIHGSWLLKPEPSYALIADEMTYEQATELSKLLGFAFAQDATVVYQPTSVETPGEIPAIYIGSNKKISGGQLADMAEAARNEGLDYSTSQDGKAVKFLYFGDNTGLEEFTQKVSRVKAAAGFELQDLYYVRSDLNEASNYVTGGDRGDRQAEWLSGGSAGPSSLFGRAVDSLLVPYAKAVGAEGYRFAVQRFADKFGLTDAQRDLIREALLPKSGLAKSTVAIASGRERLDVEPTGDRGSVSVVDIMWALQNRSAQAGLIEPGDYSPRAQKVIAEAIADEVLYHIQNPRDGKSAIGWYDRALKAAKDNYASIFPEIVTDRDAELLFDALWGITSQGNDVFSNSVFGARVYNLVRDGSKTLPEAVSILRGTFGGETRAIENNILKLHELLARNGYDAMRKFFNTKDRVAGFNKRLREDKSLYYGGEPLRVEGQADQMVTGWMVFGPKIGSFINNLHGDYSTLTADLWFSRSWNRILGYSFVHTPALEAEQYQRFISSMVAEFNHLRGRPVEPKIDAKSGKAKEWSFGNDMMGLEERKLEEVIADPYKALEFATLLEEEFRKGGHKERSDLRRAAKNWVENRNQPVAAPRTDLERSFQQDVAEAAQGIIRRKTGQTITIADIQAALWFYEKDDLFGPLGGTNKKSEGADYSGASDELLRAYNRGNLYFNKTDGRYVYGSRGSYLKNFDADSVNDAEAVKREFDREPVKEARFALADDGADIEIVGARDLERKPEALRAVLQRLTGIADRRGVSLKMEPKTPRNQKARAVVVEHLLGAGFKPEDVTDGGSFRYEARSSAERTPATNPPADLIEIFEGLDSRGLAKKRAQELAAEHPLAATIEDVNKNFLDLLQELEDAGKLKINCT